MPANGLFPPTKRDRRARIQRLEYVLKNKKSSETYQEVIAKYVLKEGVSLRKIREYLNFLKLAGRIDGGITI